MNAVRNWERAEAIGGKILLDGRELRLPEGGALRIDRPGLAAAIAAEWNAAGGGVRGGSYRFTDLTLTRLAATGSLQVDADRSATIEALLRAADTDMLCYRASAPAPLVRRQQAVWQPFLDWIEAETRAVFRVTEGVMPAAQPEAVMAAMRRVIERLDAGALASLLAVVPALGSLVLGLAFLAGRIGAAAAAAAATLEAGWEAEQWGEPETWLAARDLLEAELAKVRRFLELRAGEAWAPYPAPEMSEPRDV